jgi:hypothetical protein
MAVAHSTKKPKLYQWLAVECFSCVQRCVKYLNATSTSAMSSLKSGGFLRLVPRKVLWQHRAMIEFHTRPEGHSDIAHSPLLRAALLALRYAQEHGAIGLTKAIAFKCVLMHWAVEHFDWPRKSAEEMFCYSKVSNEYELRCTSWRGGCALVVAQNLKASSIFGWALQRQF